MVSAVAWVGLPLLLWAVGTGVGLLAERLARVKLSNGLLAPLGACVAAVARAAGLPAGRDRARSPRRCSSRSPCSASCSRAGRSSSACGSGSAAPPGWPPEPSTSPPSCCRATGPGWATTSSTTRRTTCCSSTTSALTGSTARPARRPRPRAWSTTRSTAHYPFGAFTLLATLRGVLDVETAALYQPFIATLAGLSATSLAVLARRLGMRAPWAAALGALAVCASLTYDYSAHGGVKEIALVLVLVTAAALAREGMDAHWRPGRARPRRDRAGRRHRRVLGGGGRLRCAAGRRAGGRVRDRGAAAAAAPRARRRPGSQPWRSCSPRCRR